MNHASRQLLAYAIFVITCTAPRENTASNGVKSFAPVADSSGQPLCAVDAANETKSVAELDAVYADVGLVPQTAPQQVHCAWRCTNHDPCHSFNYRLAADNNVIFCEFYFFAPRTCQSQERCVFFQVMRSILLNVLRACKKYKNYAILILLLQPTAL